MKKSRSELLARASADWFHRGLISRELAQQLAARYDRHDAFLSTVGRWLGVIAILSMASGVLAVIGMASASPLFLGALLLLAAGGVWLAGVRLTTSRTRPLPGMGATLVTLSFVLFYGGCAAFVMAMEASPERPFFIALLFLTAALAAATAYRYSLRWPLFLAGLLLFDGAGSWGAYGGHGNYFFSILHPPSMAAIAALTALVGVLHRRLEDGDFARYSGFGHIMIVLGLFYFNCSLWIMSLLSGRWMLDESGLPMALLFGAAALAQIVIGAFLKDSLFTGFGVVFLAINLYTRFFERFWDQWSAALFFTLAGLIGLLIGLGFEALHRRRSAAAHGPDTLVIR